MELDAIYTVTDKINDEWNGYDKAVAETHLANYGKIYLDGYGLPIDDLWVVEDIIKNEELH